MTATPESPCINCGNTNFAKGHPVILKGSDRQSGSSTDDETQDDIPWTPLDIPCLAFICGTCGTLRLIQPPVR